MEHAASAVAIAGDSIPTAVATETRSRALLRLAYGAALGIHAVTSMATSGGGGGLRVYYGGARSGDRGGPSVKVARLREHFAEHPWRYNLVYCLSGAVPLPGWVIGLLKRRGVPLVHNQNGVYYPAWFGGDWRGHNARMAHSYHAADHVFWQSEFCRRAADRFLGVRRGPGEVLYNAVDTTRFIPAARRQTGGRFTFLVTGGFDTHLYYRIASTLAGLREAVRGGLDAQLRIAGWTTPAVAVRTREDAARLGLGARVELLGPYSQAQAPEIYGAADAYVMTKHLDPCPNAVLEALSCGLPVVYGASGGVPELVGEAGAGVPVAEDWEQVRLPDAAELGKAMLLVAGRRDELSVAARQRAVARFDIAPWIARHRAVFEALVA